MRNLNSPPFVDANEITDKGYVNRLVTVARRQSDLVAAMDAKDARDFSPFNNATIPHECLS
jgi:hypothetical protein